MIVVKDSKIVNQWGTNPVPMEILSQLLTYAIHLVLYLDLWARMYFISDMYCNSKYYHSSSEAYLQPCRISMIELFWENS